jgi:drug/metabolite transporter (DMT)-like permease
VQLEPKTLLAILVYLVFGVSGQLLLGYAMKQLPPVELFSASDAFRMLRFVVTTPRVLLGVALLATHFGMFLALLSRLDVSVVAPAHALNYLLLTLMARFVLREQVTPLRWIGVSLITIGVALVLLSKHRK